MAELKKLTLEELNSNLNGVEVEVTIRGKLAGVLCPFVERVDGSSVRICASDAVSVVPQPLKVGNTVPNSRLHELPVYSVIKYSNMVLQKHSNHSWYVPGSIGCVLPTYSEYVWIFSPDD